jgi:hypothetical protein
MNYKGSGRKSSWPKVCLEVLEKNYKKSLIAVVPAEIRTEDLPNTGLERYG